MKILFFCSYYPEYLNQLYYSNPELGYMNYEKQLEFILSDFFSWQSSLVQSLQEKGCDTKILIVNAKELQRVWVKENRCKLSRDRTLDLDLYDIALEQVRDFQPDIVWIADRYYYPSDYLREIKENCKKLFIWIGAAFNANRLNLSDVDCVLTLSSDFKDRFELLGLRSEKVFPAFDNRILNNLPKDPIRDIECSFVGSLTYSHLKRITILKQVVDKTDVKVWGRRPYLSPRSALKNPHYLGSFFKAWSIRSRLESPVWGLNMYSIMLRSKLSLNIHVDAAGDLSANIRMFEATGMGSLLITEKSSNIHELYEPGKEVLVYSNVDEMIDLISFYSENNSCRESIAIAGQEKTLRFHNVDARSLELLSIFEKYLK
jgi:spore maturation protein CgeB